MKTLWLEMKIVLFQTHLPMDGPIPELMDTMRILPSH